jgi:hypothetical protein
VQKFKYTGDDPVDVPALGLVDVTKGTHIDVSDPDLAAGLHGQPQWEHIPDPERSKAAKKAAASRADNEED